MLFMMPEDYLMYGDMCHGNNKELKIHLIPLKIQGGLVAGPKFDQNMLMVPSAIWQQITENFTHQYIFVNALLSLKQKNKQKGIDICNHWRFGFWDLLWYREIQIFKMGS